MRNDYIITNSELAERGLDLNDYVLHNTLIPAIIYNGLSITIARMCELGDMSSERECEQYLSSDDEKRTSEDKVKAFKEIQYWILYNLIMVQDDDPRNSIVDSIFVFQLGMKINTIQKGIFRRG